MRRACDRLPFAERFYRKVVMLPGGCWLWTGAVITRRGGHYPCQKADAPSRKTINVIRWVLTLKTEDPGHGLHAAHVGCSNTRCVNPDHLTWSTGPENIGELLARLPRDARGRFSTPSPALSEVLDDA